jgi:uncharacterized protein (DUF1800 family)
VAGARVVPPSATRASTARASAQRTVTRAPALVGRATLPSLDRLVATRFSGGLNATLAGDVRRAGGGRAWLTQQLRPARVPDAPGTAIDGWFPSLQRIPQQIFQRQVDDVQGSWQVMWDLSRWTVARRIQSRRQVAEVMVDFWSNLLHVPLGDDEAPFWRVDYDRAIRKHALTSFEALLLATVTHPAMGLYLDNATSTKEAPNENLGRELLELHTVGVEAGYTEDDVKASSRLLTGYRVDVWWPSFRSFYDPAAHATGPVRVMDFSHPNADRDGRAATEAYLRHLARHPATARRIARRLCQKFVSDSPSSDLVETVAATYLRSGTDVRSTLLAMVDHPEFAGSSGAKVRMPTEDYVATARALRLELKPPRDERSFVNAMYWQYVEFGQAPYEWPAPNGYPEAGAAWTSAGRLLGGMRHHLHLAAGWWPSAGVRRPAPGAWLPDLPATLDEVVSHIGRELLGQRPSAPVRQAVATVLGVPLKQRMTRDQLWDFRVQAILATLLDSPTHLRR